MIGVNRSLVNSINWPNRLTQSFDPATPDNQLWPGQIGRIAKMNAAAPQYASIGFSFQPAKYRLSA